MYAMYMEVSITQFRRTLFDYVNRALAGERIEIVHRGQKFQVVPEKRSGDRLERITSLQVVNPKAPPLDQDDWKLEMAKEWEQDWVDL
jgi:prevent-host-death family protein